MADVEKKMSLSLDQIIKLRQQQRPGKGKQQQNQRKPGGQPSKGNRAPTMLNANKKQGRAAAAPKSISTKGAGGKQGKQGGASMRQRIMAKRAASGAGSGRPARAPTMLAARRGIVKANRAGNRRSVAAKIVNKARTAHQARTQKGSAPRQLGGTASGQGRKAKAAPKIVFNVRGNGDRMPGGNALQRTKGLQTGRQQNGARQLGRGNAGGNRPQQGRKRQGQQGAAARDIDRPASRPGGLLSRTSGGIRKNNAPRGLLFATQAGSSRPGAGNRQRAPAPRRQQEQQRQQLRQYDARAAPVPQRSGPPPRDERLERRLSDQEERMKALERRLLEEQALLARQLHEQRLYTLADQVRQQKARLSREQRLVELRQQQALTQASLGGRAANRFLAGDADELDTRHHDRHLYSGR